MTTRGVSMPAVSVIMPSYNHAAFVAEAIESVLAQSLTDLELIIIDDGSSDGTQDIIRGFSDPRIRTVFRERNLGSAQGSNEGLRLARSPLIAMISSDDAFAPHKLERQMHLMQEDRSMIAVFCRPRIVDANGREDGPGRERLRDTFVAGRWSQVELVRRLFFSGNFLCHPSAMVRREIFDRVGHYDVRLNSLGDFDMWTRIAVAMPGDFVVLDEPLMSFRVHATNTSGLTLGNLRCGENEWPLVIGRFGNLKARPDIFAAAFPEVGEHLQGSPVDFDYALARLALGHHVRSVRGFGVRQLYQLMGDEGAADRLEMVHGFTTRELIRTSKETDTAGVVAPKSRRTSARVTRELRRLSRQLNSLAATAVTTLRPSGPCATLPEQHPTTPHLGTSGLASIGRKYPHLSSPSTREYLSMPMRRLLRLGKPKIFCISFQRTGTTSVGRFFRDFGYRTVGWSEAERHHFPEAWLEGDHEYILNHPVVRRGQVFEDSPWFHPDFYKILYHRFPGSKFILMTRKPDAWFSSMLRHELIPGLVNTESHCKIYRRERELLELVSSGRFNGGERLKLEDAPDHYKAIYELHHREAEAFFQRNAPGALFRGALEDAQKWRKLADFMGLKIPLGYEAHENSSSRH